MGSPAADRIAVGKIGPAIGLKGEVYVQPWTDAPEERFAPGSVLFTEPAGVGPLTVSTYRVHGKRFVVRFDSALDRSAAEQLRDVQLLIDPADRPELEDPDEFYDSDLVGLAAVSVAGESLGSVLEVLHAPATEYLVVVHEGRQVLVPFVSAIVPEVDLAARTVLIDPPEGLFEL